MKLAILSRNAKLYSTRRLIEAARARGHRVRVLDPLRCYMHIAPGAFRIRYKGKPLADLLTEAEQRVYLPLIHPGPSEALEGVDCVWYLRGKATFLWEVEWTAMLDEAVIRRGARIPTTETLYRFLVIPPERTELVRLKLARSPVLRARLEEDNWHIIKSDHLVRMLSRENAGLDDLEPLLGLDPATTLDVIAASSGQSWIGEHRLRHTFDDQLAIASRAAGMALERVLKSRRG